MERLRGSEVAVFQSLARPRLVAGAESGFVLAAAVAAMALLIGSGFASWSFVASPLTGLTIFGLGATAGRVDPQLTRVLTRYALLLQRAYLARGSRAFVPPPVRRRKQ